MRTNAFVAFGAETLVAVAFERAWQVYAKTLAGLQREALVNVNTMVALQFVAFIALAFIRSRQINATPSALVIEAFVDVCTETFNQTLLSERNKHR